MGCAEAGQEGRVVCGGGRGCAGLGHIDNAQRFAWLSRTGATLAAPRVAVSLPSAHTHQHHERP